MTTLRAVDASFDDLTLVEATCLANSDTPLFVQCLWTGAVQPLPRITSLYSARHAGLMTAGYISLNRRHTGVWHTNTGRAGVPDEVWEAFKFVAIDIELDGIRVEDIVAACQRVVELGQRPIIYTNYNTWMNKVIPANPDDLARMGILLWNAYWDLWPDIDFPHCRFGGWRDDQVMLEQWSGGAYICGTFVDRNTVIRELLLAGEEEAMPTAEYNELTTKIDDLGRVVTAVAKQLDGRLGGVESGEVMMPIWPIGLVPLRTILHRGFYSLPILSGTALIRAVRRLCEAARCYAENLPTADMRAALEDADDALYEAEEATH